MLLYEQGKPYWEVARRFHAHRDNPAIHPTAVRDMQRIQQSTTSPAVQRRVASFIARHQTKPPSNNDGPRVA